jgi:hypothetical protein
MQNHPSLVSDPGKEATGKQVTSGGGGALKPEIPNQWLFATGSIPPPMPYCRREALSATFLGTQTESQPVTG